MIGFQAIVTPYSAGNAQDCDVHGAYETNFRPQFLTFVELSERTVEGVAVTTVLRIEHTHRLSAVRTAESLLEALHPPAI